MKTAFAAGLAAALALLLPARALALDVSGTLAADTVWSAGTTYRITGPLTVPAGVTLTVEPGARVEAVAAPTTTLTVRGTLKAGVTAAGAESPSQPVVFTREGSSGTWGGLVFDSGSSANVFKNAEVSWGDKCLKVATAGLELVDVRVHDCASNCIYVSGATSTLTFTGTAAALPAGGAIAPTARVHACGSSGILNEGTLTVTRAEITECSGHGVASTGGAQIEFCNVHHNGVSTAGFGVSLTSGSASATQSITGSTLHHNLVGGAIVTLAQSGASATVASNTFDANQTATTGHTYELYVSTPAAGTVTVRDNLFVNDTDYGVYRSGSGGTVTLSYNLFDGIGTQTSGTVTSSNTLSVNPLLAATDGTNYRLTANSPARGASSTGGDLGALAFAGDPTPILAGILRSDLTLTAAGSPWSLAGDLTVPAGVTLTLEAGATINPATSDAMRTGTYSWRVELEVFGTLVVDGTAANPVTILPANPSYKSWNGIALRSGAVATFSHVEIGYAEQCLYAASGTAASLTNARIHHCTKGVYASGAVALTGDAPQHGGPFGYQSRVWETSEEAVVGYGSLSLSNTEISAGYPNLKLGGAATVTGNSIHDAKAGTNGWGVSISVGSNANARVRLARNLIHHNPTGGILVEQSSYTSTPTPTEIDHNTLDANGPDGIRVTANSSTTLPHTIRNNIVTGHATYCMVMTAASTPTGLTVDHNLTNGGTYSKISSGTGSLTYSDPKYNHPTGTTFGPDYRLQPGSPARWADSSTPQGDLGAFPYLELVPGRVEMSPTTASVKVGKTQTFTLTGYEDWSDYPITGGAVAYSVDPAHPEAGVISSAGKFLAGCAVGSYPALVRGQFGGFSASAEVTLAIGPPSLVVVTPAEVTLDPGQTAQFSASAVDFCGNAIADAPTWSVYSASYGTITSSGFFTAGTTPGPHSVTASYGSGSSGYATATITGTTPVASVSMSPAGGRVLAGGTLRFTARGQDTNYSTVAITPYWWLGAGCPAGTTVDSSSGLFTAGATAGSCTLNVRDSVSWRSDSRTVTVTSAALSTLSISGSPQVPANTTYRFTAYGTDASSNRIEVSPAWSASGAGAIDADGVFTAATTGSFTITATLGSLTATLNGTIVAGAPVSLAISPSPFDVGVYKTARLGATITDAWGNTASVTPSSCTWTVLHGGGTVSYDGVFTALGIRGTFANTVRATYSGLEAFATARVVQGPVDTLVIVPSRATMTVGEIKQFAVLGYDAAEALVPVSVDWSVGSSGGGAIDPSGLYVAGTVAGTYVGAVHATTTGSTYRSASATIDLLPGPMTGITITAAYPEVRIRGQQRFTATGHDGYGNPIPISAVWSVVGTSGTIDANGVFTAGSVSGDFPGAIKAVDPVTGLNGTYDLTIRIGTPISVAISPATASVGINSTHQFTLLGTDADGNTGPLKSNVGWYISSGTAGTIAYSTGLFTAGSVLGTYVSAISGTCWDCYPSLAAFATVTVVAGPPTSLTISPVNPTVAARAQRQFTATGKDAQNNNATISGTWSVVDPAAGTIDPTTGMFTAGGTLGTYAGAVRFVDTASNVSGTTSVTVTPGAVASITVSPGSATVAAGSTRQFSATAADADGNAVSFAPAWSLVSCTRGTLSSAGLFTATTPGSCPGGIKASYGTVSGTASVEVVAGPPTSIVLTPTNPTLAARGQRQFTASGRDAGGNAVAVDAVWSVLVPAAGSIDAAGLFTAGSVAGSYANAVKVADATSGVSATTGVTVVTGAPVSITIAPANATVVVGGTQQYTATGTDADGNTGAVTVTWSLASCTKGTLSANGLFTAGTTPGACPDGIRATSGAISATASVEVVAGALAQIAVAPNTVSVDPAGTQLFTATPKDSYGNPVAGTMTWSVLNASAGSINASGLFTAGSAAGTYGNVIKATSGSIFGYASVTVRSGALATITVAPSSPTVATGATVQFTATGRDSLGNAVSLTPTWSVVGGGGTISATGLFSAGALPGTYPDTIRATSGTVSGSASVTLVAGALARLVISPSPASVAAGDTLQLAARGEDSAGNPVAINPSWSVLAGGGTIGASTGLFTAGTVAGHFTNTVKVVSGAFSATTSVDVTPGPVDRVLVTPASATVAAGEQRTFTAAAADAWGNAVADPPSWAVVAGGGVISAGGVFTAGTAAGTFRDTVQAMIGGKTGFASVIVSPGAATELAIDPPSAVVSLRETRQFVARAKDLWGNAAPVAVTWQVSTPDVGSVSATGLFTAGARTGSYPGAVVATAGTLNAAADVTVISGEVASLEVTPRTVELKPGEHAAFVARAKDSEGNLVPVTATWTLADRSAGSLEDDGAFTAGTTVGFFADVVVATAGTHVGFASVTVGAPPLARVAIAPENPTLALGHKVAFSARALLANGTEIQGLAASWTLTGTGGVLSSSGELTAGTVPGVYPNAVQVTLGGASASTGFILPVDFDGDGIDDAWELSHGLDPTVAADAQLDPDHDGLVNADEFRAGTHPNDADSDDDGVLDGNEQRPFEDTDGDGLKNAMDSDSDDDGLPDGLEMGVTSPNADTDMAKGHFVADADPASTTDPLSKDTDGDGHDDGKEDANHNGKVDDGETDPNVRNCAVDLDCGGARCVDGVCGAPGVCVPECGADEVCDPQTLRCETTKAAQQSGCGCGVAAGAPTAGLVALLLGLALRRRWSRGCASD